MQINKVKANIVNLPSGYVLFSTIVVDEMLSPWLPLSELKWYAGWISGLSNRFTLPCTISLGGPEQKEAVKVIFTTLYKHEHCLPNMDNIIFVFVTEKCLEYLQKSLKMLDDLWTFKTLLVTYNNRALTKILNV